MMMMMIWTFHYDLLFFRLSISQGNESESDLISMMMLMDEERERERETEMKRPIFCLFHQQ